MARGCDGVASDELCLLVVLNTASIQLLPATIASVRSAAGAESPFDILPAVWLSSALSVIVGLTAASCCPNGGGGGIESQLPGDPGAPGGVAACGLGRRVDVYAALTHGAEEVWRCCCGSCRPWWAF